MELKNKVALVTGSSKGIGLSICQTLLEEGMTVVGWSRSTTPIQHARFVSVTCDVGNSESVKKAWELTKKSVREPIQVLINNAGFGFQSKFEESDEELWRKMFDVNVHGVLYCSKAVIPDMKLCDEGHIINIASIAGKTGVELFSGYSGTKFAVRGISEAMFKELREHGIKVTCVFPGSINTHFFDDIPSVTANENMLDANDVAKSISYLLKTSENFLPNEFEIRPLRPKGKQKKQK